MIHIRNSQHKKNDLRNFRGGNASCASRAAGFPIYVAKSSWLENILKKKPNAFKHYTLGPAKSLP